MDIKHVIWAEKYRPSSLEDFAIDPILKDKIASFIQTKEIPHLLLYGPPGTGKTSLAMFLARTCLQADVKHINASDESGIDIVRNKIRPFASTMSFTGLKVVILDEFERMSSDAQDALRSLMEMFSHTTRFILTTNYIDRVTEPIRSRCQEFVIKETPKENVAEILSSILDKEEIRYQLADVAFIVNRFYPDIRKCINEMQKSVNLSSKNLEVSKLDVGKLSEFEDLVIKLLFDTDTVHAKLTRFRQLVADYQIMTFLPLYRSLYDIVDDQHLVSIKKAMWYIAIAEAINQDTTSPDKEITATALISKLLTI